ncbi:hypothetical protein JHN63_01930 [Streptomyces sp. MBT65]|uniref:hypothetical protein n=1 Tax=Streptomyces sp. MBT65 TaxID=1488395 RepID=UPI00190C8305|nr:hypothetical protein [Streptomyces sp. MBT65]MBK3572601.1 hypothetical protein [Streptomyces sp. MBT65]
MPRLQILELPTEHHGDDMSTPYLLIIDEAPSDDAAFDALRRDLADNDLVARTGARAVLCFEATMELPAYQAVPGEQIYPVTFQVLPDFTEFRAQVASELQTTQQHLAEFVRGQTDEQVRLAAQRAASEPADLKATPRPTYEEAHASLSGDHVPGRQA